LIAVGRGLPGGRAGGMAFSFAESTLRMILAGGWRASQRVRTTDAFPHPPCTTRDQPDALGLPGSRARRTIDNPEKAAINKCGWNDGPGRRCDGAAYSQEAP
jgi:hypothetical protein